MINKLMSATKGFTLIETLVAVLLLAIAIAGPLTIASRGLNSALVAKDQITAFYLAQDAVEYVRFARDSACLAAGTSPCATGTWLSSLSSCVSASGCYIDSIQSTVGPYSSCPTTNCILNYDKSTGYYGYSSGTASPARFKRTIIIQNDPSGSSPDEAIVTVTVTWSDVAGVTHPGVVVRENLFRWQ